MHPVFVARGDRLAELDALIAELGGPEPAGLHRRMYVTRADQTVAMAADSDSPMAVALRRRAGWSEPRDT